MVPALGKWLDIFGWYQSLHLILWDWICKLGLWDVAYRFCFCVWLCLMFLKNWKQHLRIKGVHIKEDFWVFLKIWPAFCLVVKVQSQVAAYALKGAFSHSPHHSLLLLDTEGQVFFAVMYIIWIKKKFKYMKKYFSVDMLSKSKERKERSACSLWHALLGPCRLLVCATS